METCCILTKSQPPVIDESKNSKKSQIMGPKLKKQQKNAFSFFLDDYVENERRRGRNVSHRIAAEECGPMWMDMPEGEKQKYKNLAATNKVYLKDEKKNKFTCIGTSYLEVERQEQEMKLKAERSENEMKTTICNLDSESLKTHLFYMVHCNYYCKTDEGVYVPGEIAVVEFNLQDGIRRTYHTLINPGKIPQGYAFEAKMTIESIHDLPYPPYDEGESNYLKILDDILKFIEPGKLPDGQYPPLYCIENNIKASENILQTLSDNKMENKNYFRVYLLHKMFFYLKNSCVDTADEEYCGFPVLANADSEIKKDIFCYVPGISCAFHATSEDKYQSCSLSVVQRFVYTICDHCCQYLGIELIPGKHSRMKADVKRKLTKSKIVKTSQKSQSSTNEVPESDYDGRSSCCGESTIYNWGTKQKGSFLHEELESKYGSISSLDSKSSAFGFSQVRKGYGKPKPFVNESSDDDDIHTFSLGRGISHN